MSAKRYFLGGANGTDFSGGIFSGVCYGIYYSFEGKERPNSKHPPVKPVGIY